MKIQIKGPKYRKLGDVEEPFFVYQNEVWAKCEWHHKERTIDCITVGCEGRTLSMDTLVQFITKMDVEVE